MSTLGLRHWDEDLCWMGYQDLIGDIGEEFADRWLSDSGFEVHPGSASFYNIGCSFLGSAEGRRMPPQLHCMCVWELANVCARTLTCRVTGTPCQNHPDDFFTVNDGPTFRDLSPDTGDNKFRHHCMDKLTFLATLGKCGEACEMRSCRAKALLQIEAYFQMLWAEQTHYPCIKKWCEKWRGFPGGLDLYATKDNALYALDVKTGNGQMSNWQALRLAWLVQHGFNGGVVRVLLEVSDKARLLGIYQAFDKEVGYSSGADNAVARMKETRAEFYLRRQAAMREIMEQALILCRVSSIEIEMFNPGKHRACKFLPTPQQLQDTIRLSHHSRRYGLAENPGDAEERDRLFLSLPMPTQARADADSAAPFNLRT